MKRIVAFLIGFYGCPAIAMSEAVVFEANRFASAMIDKSGGKVQLEGIGVVEFPRDSFASATTVSIRPTAAAEISEIFSFDASLFGPMSVHTNSVTIGTGLQRPISNSIKAKIHVPDVVKKESATGARIEIFAGILQGGANEIPYTSFSPLESVYNEKTGELVFELFTSAFANTELTSGEYQAILVIGAFPKKM